MPDGLGDLATQQPQLGPPVWKQTGVRNAAGQLMVRDQFGNWQVAPGQGDVGTGDDGTTQPVPAPAVAPAPQLVPGRQSYAQPAQANGLQASVAPLDGQAAGVPVPPSLVPIYNRESRFNFQAQNPTSTASGAGQDVDATWREASHALGYGDRWAHAKDAPPEVQNAVNIWLQGRYGKKPWAASEPGRAGADLGAFGQAYQRQALRDYDTERQNMQTVRAELDKATPGSDTYRKLIGRALERSDALQQEFMNTMRHPPAQTPVDAMSNFGSLATVIAIFGGLFARRPLTASLNAAGMAMQAHNQGNYEAYQRSYDTWKTQTGLLKDMLSEQNTQIRNVLEMENIEEREKMERINVLASTFGQDRLAAAALRGDIQEVYSMAQAAQKLPGELERQRAQIEGIYAHTQADRALAKEREQEAQYGKTPQMIALRSYLAEHPDATSEEISRFIKESQVAKTPQMVALQSYLDANPAATPAQIAQYIQGLSSPRSMPGMVMRQYMTEHPEATYEDMQRVADKYRRDQSIETGFGSGVQGRNLISLNTVADHISFFRQYADALRNHDLQAANKIENRIASEAGAPEVINFALAGTITGDEVIRLLTTTGGTLADREDIHKLLAAYASPRQMQGAADTLENFVRGRYGPLRQQYGRGDPAREKVFDEEMVTPEARKLFTRAPRVPVKESGEKTDRHPDQIQGGWLFKWSSQQNKYVADHQVQ